jgi:transcriptional regulator with XRE-family HTH domain
MLAMDDQRIGRIVRALRRRLGWRQIDLAGKAGCSQTVVSEGERGHLPSLPILRRMLAALDASLVIDVRWRAGALDRLLDEDHAALVAAVTELLALHGWDIRVEVTYSDYGDRGSIDILAFMPATGVLLVIEIKTELAAVESTLRKIDEKVRVAPEMSRKRFDWDVRSVGWLLVMPESSTLRRRVERHPSLFARVFPARGSEIRRWLRQPAGGIAGLWFLSPSGRSTVIRGRGGRNRVRVVKRPSGTAAGAV